MKIGFYGSSLVSAYWNGAATYYRGLLRALAAHGYDITFYEPDVYDRQKNRDIDPPAWCKVVVYDGTIEALKEVTAEAAGADVVVKASGVGFEDDLLLEELLRSARPEALKIFWDVDAPRNPGRSPSGAGPSVAPCPSPPGSGADLWRRRSGGERLSGNRCPGVHPDLQHPGSRHPSSRRKRSAFRRGSGVPWQPPAGPGDAGRAVLPGAGFQVAPPVLPARRLGLAGQAHAGQPGLGGPCSHPPAQRLQRDAEGVAVIDAVAALSPQRLCFYDIDTPVTLAKLDRQDEEYLAHRQIPIFDAYFSFSGGEGLDRLERAYGARHAVALYCSVDADRYGATGEPCAWDLGYLGTYSPDRQPVLEKLLIGPARRLPHLRFVVAGPQYPREIDWPANVERIDHLPPAEHAAFYSRQRFTLNVTRADMIAAGWSPSVRIFEAAA